MYMYMYVCMYIYIYIHIYIYIYNTHNTRAGLAHAIGLVGGEEPAGEGLAIIRLRDVD